MLLRGHEASALQKYSDAFHKDEKSVISVAQQLKGVVADSEARAVKEELLRRTAPWRKNMTPP